MARCGKCLGEFEGARQPNCPLCGAERPRPRVRIVEKPPSLEANVVALQARAEPLSPRKERKRRRRERTVPSDPLGQRMAPIAAVPPVPVEAVGTEALAEKIEWVAPPPHQGPKVAEQPKQGPPKMPRPPKVLGPPPIEVEYVFGGVQPDEITLVTTIEVLEHVERWEPEGPAHNPITDLGAAGKKALDRAKTRFRRG